MATPSKQTTDVETQASSDEMRTKLLAILKDSRTVLLLSHGADNKIAGRPMGLVKADDDATLYLVTGMDSKKVDEMLRSPRVSIAATNLGRISIPDRVRPGHLMLWHSITSSGKACCSEKKETKPARFSR